MTSVEFANVNISGRELDSRHGRVPTAEGRIPTADSTILKLREAGDYSGRMSAIEDTMNPRSLSIDQQTAKTTAKIIAGTNALSSQGMDSRGDSRGDSRFSLP